MLIWGCVTMFGAIAVAASLKILSREGIRVAGEFTPYVSVLALLVVFFGMGMMCLAMLESYSPRRRSREQASAVEQTANSQVRQLPDQPFSVIERTTEFFEDTVAPVRVRDTKPNDE
jgi:TRAP-type C4-dicarboxylate transport system permease small subunit